MIFSKFFNNKPQWQNKNSNVRIEAINELEPNVVDHKKILDQLIYNDNVELVRRAALIKVNSFEDYVAASKENSAENIKIFAHKQVIKILLGEHDIILTLAQKQNVLLNTTDYGIRKEVLEAWLFVESENSLVKDIFHQLAKPHLLYTLFNKTEDENIQLFLLEQVHDINSLEKLIKKALNTTIKEKIEGNIFALINLAEKPIKLRKTVQLLLSKLLAIKNLNDYEVVLKKRQEMDLQWQSLQDEFTILTKTENEDLFEKYQDINKQLDKAFVVKSEKHQQNQIEKKLKQQQQDIEQVLNAEIDTINQALITSVFENTIDPMIFTKKLAVLLSHVQNSCLNDHSKALYQNKISQLEQRFEQLPEIAQSVSTATQLISKISELALPESLASFIERYQVFQQWLKDWKRVEQQSSGMLPKSIIDAYQEIKKRWKIGCEPFLKQQEKTFFQTRKIANDIVRLLDNGKYNACFGLYKKLQKQRLLLSLLQQQKLQRDLTFIDERMVEISDWEHYIATPKKQELLLSIQTLVEQPCDNPNDQAEKVKQHRKQWNLLGHADDEIDQSLNEQFNDCCELAFAPCRTFYAEQEKIREQNHQNRLVLIDEANTFAKQLFQEQQAEVDIDFKALEHQLNKLSQKWQNAGEVERNLYIQLFTKFEAELVDIKKAIFNQHEKNSTAKQQLISHAEKLLSQINLAENNVEQILSATKSLQQQWRNIGYAGVKKENKLWQTFRRINDEIFSKRDQNKQATQLLIAEQEQLFSKSLAELTKQFQDDITREFLDESLKKTQELHEKILAHKPVMKQLLTQVELLIKNIRQVFTSREIEQQRRHWQTLFNLLREIASSNISQVELQQQILFKQLTNSWQKKIIEVNNSQKSVDRENNTLEIEIFANVSSPIELTQQRMAVQVSLMQEQMTSVNKPDLEESLIKWLQLGRLSEQDLSLIERIEKIFVSQDVLEVPV